MILSEGHFFFRKPLPTTFRVHKCNGISYGLSSDIKTVALLEGTELKNRDVGSSVVASVGTIFELNCKDRQQFIGADEHRVSTMLDALFP
jgi:hypothetical protein